MTTSLVRRRLEVRSLIVSCTQCDLRAQLARSLPAATPIPFSGPLHPRFVILGEAPGVTEHRKGQPFVGQSGRLLRSMLRQSGLDVDWALIVNTVCCCPYGPPSQVHEDACRPHLEAQLALAPDIPLLAVGQVAFTALVPEGQVRHLQGSALIIDGRPVMPVFHPAYVGRDLTAKPGVMAALGRFRSLLDGLDPDFFAAATCCICAGEATDWDDRQMPYCRKHRAEIQRNKRRVIRRRTAENRARQQRMELT